MIELTENAITHLKNLTEKNEKNYVRLSIKGGGCAGFEYDWTFEDEEGYTRDDILLEDLLLIDKMKCKTEFIIIVLITMEMCTSK